MLLRLCYLLTALLGVACAAGSDAPQATEGPPNVEEAIDFTQEAEREILDIWMLNDRASWVNQTNITDDTDWLAARVGEQMLATERRLLDASRRYRGLDLPPDIAR